MRIERISSSGSWKTEGEIGYISVRHKELVRARTEAGLGFRTSTDGWTSFPTEAIREPGEGR